MRIELTQNVVLRGLSIDQKPTTKQGAPAPNPNRTAYIVLDSHRDAPTGFGVKVSATKKTYIVQRRVGKKVIKAKVGDVSDFANISAAREAAKEMVRSIQTERRNPNVTQRSQAAYEQSWTFGGVFASYRDHLMKRSKPAKASTIRALEAARPRLAGFWESSVKDLKASDILKAFDAGIRKVKNPKTGVLTEVGRTATELAFHWASAAMRYALRREIHDARADGREPRHNIDPFEILSLEGRFRSKAQLERSYAERGSRNPMGFRDGSLARFLAAVWTRRPQNRKGCDYLLLTLLLGARQQESASLQWRDRLSDEEARKASWVDLKLRQGHFHNTKNGSDHDFPLTDGVYELLKQRQDDRETGERHVFPVRLKGLRKTATHYTDPKTILSYVAEDAGIEVLRTHDLRRTFGRIAEEHTSAEMVKKMLNHLRPGDATERYTKPEWERFAEVLQKMETLILAECPVVYNALLPARTYPRMETTNADRRNPAQRG